MDCVREQRHTFLRRRKAFRVKLAPKFSVTNTTPHKGWYSKPSLPIASYLKTFNPICPCLATGQGASYSIVVGDGNSLETNQGANGLTATVPVNSTFSGEVVARAPRNPAAAPHPPPAHKEKKPKANGKDTWDFVKKLLPDPKNEVSLLDVDRISTATASTTAIAVQSDLPPILAYEGKFEYPPLTGETVSTIDNLADRYFQLDSFDWSPSLNQFQPLSGKNSVKYQAPEIEYSVWALPESVLKANPKQAFVKAFETNAYYRCGWEVMLEVNGTFFHQGAIAIIAIPEGDAPSAFTGSIGRTLVYPHAILNIRTSNQARLVLPYASANRLDPTTGATFPKVASPGLTVKSYHQQWVLVVWVISPLQILNGEQNLVVNMLARPLEAQFMGPHYSYGQPVVMRELVGTAGLATTQPMQEFNAVNWSPEIPDPSWLAGEYKTMSQLAKVPSLDRIIRWYGGSANPAGKILYQTPITTANLVEMDSWLSFAMQQYTQWRGTIMAHFTFCGARQQSGKLLISFLPLSTTKNPTLEEMMSGTYTVWDIGLNSTLSFVIPFCSSTSWKAIGSSSGLEFSQALGVLYIAVYNPLVTPYGATNAPVILSWSGGDDFQLRQPTAPRLFGQSDDQITNLETEVKTELLPAQLGLGNMDQSDIVELLSMYRPFWTGSNFSESRIDVDESSTSNLVWYISLDPTDWSSTSIFSKLVKSFTYISGNLHVKFTVYCGTSYNQFTFAVSYIPPGGMMNPTMDQAMNMPLVQMDMDGYIMREIPVNIPQSCMTEVIPTHYAGFSDLTRKVWGRLSGSGWGTLAVSITPRNIGSTAVRASWWMDARVTNARVFMPRIQNPVGGNSSQQRVPFSLTYRSAAPLWKPNQVTTDTIDYSDVIPEEAVGQATNSVDITHDWRECWLWEGINSFALSDGTLHIVVDTWVHAGDLDGLTKIHPVPLVKFLQLCSLLGHSLVIPRAEFLDLLLDSESYSAQTQLGVLDLPPSAQCTGQGIIENTRIAAESVSYASMNLERALTQERLDKISEISKAFMLASENVQQSVSGINAALEAITPILKGSPIIEATEGLAGRIVSWVIKFLGLIVIVATNFTLPTLLGVFMLISSEYLVKVSFDIFKDSPIQGLCDWLCDQLKLGKRVNVEEVIEFHDPVENPGEGPSGQSFKPKDFNDWANFFRNIDWAASRIIALVTKLIERIQEARKEPEIGIFWYHDDIINLYSDSIKSLSLEDLDKTQLSINLNEVRRLLSLSLKAGNVGYQTLLKQALSNYTQAQASLQRTIFTVRPEPVVLYIYGGPGSGKSVLAGLLARAISKALTGKVDDIYAPSSFGADHFDGYHQQTVHMIDDLGQAVDGSDWANFCNMVSSAPWAPPMAKLEEKGMYYTSKVVIVTANFNLPNYASAREPKALERRLHYKLFLGGQLNVDFACAPDGQPMRHFKSGCPLLRNSSGNLKDSGSILTCKFKDADDLVDLVVGEVRRRAGLLSMWDDLVGQGDTESQPGFFRSVYNTFAVAVGKNPPVDDLEEVRKLHKRAAWLRAIFAGLGVLAGVLTMWKVLQKPNTPCEEPEAVSATREETTSQGPYTSIPHQYRKVQKPAERLKMEKAKYQGVPPILKKVHDSVKWVSFFSDSIPVGSCSAWNFVDRFYMTVNHMWEKASSLKIGSVMYNKSDLRSTRIGEAVVFYVPSVPQGKNLLRFVKARSIKGVRAGFLAGNMDGIPNTVRVWDMTVFRGIETQDGIFNEHCLGYRCASYSGLCGAPLILEDPADYRIAGLHFAGYSGFSGFAVHFMKQELLDAMAKLSTPQSKITPLPDEVTPVHIPRHTVLKPSPAAGAYPTLLQPAILSQRDCRLQEGLILDETIFEKHDKGDTDEPWKNLEEAFNIYFNQFQNKEIRTLTLHEAINGTPLLDGLDMNQSPGYPYNTQGVSRRSLFTWNEQGWWDPVPELVGEVEKALEDPSTYYYTTFLKDELRKNEKVEKGSTRVIEAAPLPVILAGRMLLGGLFEEMQSKPGEYGSAVGCDPEVDWTKFFWRFEAFPNVYDLDYKAFDSTVPTAAFNLLAMHLERLIGDPRITRYIQSIANSRHIYASNVYLMQGGMPSGCVGTSILNTICNNCFLLSALLEHKDFDLDSYYVIAYGDDIVYATNPPIPPTFIKEFYDKHTPLKVTPADKGSEFNNNSTIFDVTFLKRSFVPDPKKPWLIHPLIDPTVYEQSVMWVRDGDWQDTIDSLCQLAVHSGPNTYARWVETVRAKAKTRGVTPRFYPFDYLHRRWEHKLED
nr:MAG: polyprotein [Picornaviridae sp.]